MLMWPFEQELINAEPKIHPTTQKKANGVEEEHPANTYRRRKAELEKTA